MDVPAVWNVYPDADREQLDDLLSRLTERLEIATPEVQGDTVLLPADYPSVSRALDEVQPGWQDEHLLVPPEP